MLIRRATVLVVCAAAMVVGLLVEPALADDGESGSLTCSTGQQVMITERTSAGVTTIVFGSHVSRVAKAEWTTTRTFTGLRSTSWWVTTTGVMDHYVTGASCVFGP